MVAKVSRLTPRRGSYEDALEAFASGDFSLCSDLLSETLKPEAIVLNARATMRTGGLNEALEMLNSCSAQDMTHETAAEAFSLKAYILQASLRPDDALEVGAEARVRCFSAGLVAIEAELIFAQVIGSVLADDYEAAEVSIAEILSLKDLDLPWLTPRSYRYSLNYWRSRAFEIRGVLAHAKGDHEVQARWLRRALEEFDLADVRDDYTEASMLANFVDAAIGTGSTEVVEFALERAKRIKWSMALVTLEFRVFSAIADVMSALGDQVGALRYFRRCLDCSPSVPLQIRASVERARLLSDIGESFSAREELDHAVRLSKNVDWDHASSLDQRQLVFLAAQVASYSSPEAQRLMDRFDAVTARLLSVITLRDERFRGDVLAARAAIARANESRDRAILLFIDALEVFTTAGYDAKAAAIAAELADLTSEPHYIAIAQKQCRIHPQSLLARKMSRFEAAKPRAPRVFRKPTLTLV